MAMFYKEGLAGQFVIYCVLFALVIYLAANELANGLLIVGGLVSLFIFGRRYRVLTDGIGKEDITWIFTLLLYPMCFLYAFILYQSKIDAETFVEFFRISLLVVMVFLVARKSRVLTFTTLKVAISVFAGLTGSLGIIVWFIQGGGRISVGTSLINMYALLITCAAGMVMLFCLIESVDMKKLYYRACFITAVGGVFASGSKSAILALICVFLCLSVFHVFRNRGRLKDILILLMPLILFGSMMNPFSRIESMISSVDMYVEEQSERSSTVSSTGQRVQMYRAAIVGILDEPFLGKGTWRLGEIFPDRIESGSLAISTKRYVHVHNEILQAWLTRGVPGVLLLLMLFLVPMKAVKSSDLFPKGCIYITLFVYMIFAMFEAPLNANVSYAFFMIVISLLLACRSGVQDYMVEFSGS
ncbi:O-antigen ligase [Amphritea atlantica]|uniref:O-antigen ligase n=1 Tax=Amphritea atlantica TaxID=355243 RepID=A0A1H9JYS6_9GAMM|nr:O-antigen ligase family protein [Amphritea atlantica]SEQ91958.1 O-antigen ligase [Amphritea atlantica]